MVGYCVLYVVGHCVLSGNSQALVPYFCVRAELHPAVVKLVETTSLPTPFLCVRADHSAKAAAKINYLIVFSGREITGIV